MPASRLHGRFLRDCNPKRDPRHRILCPWTPPTVFMQEHCQKLTLTCSEVPSVLVRVTATEPMAFMSPCTLKGISRLNWLPNCPEAALWYHALKVLLRSTVSEVV